jgi:hypothetical protein
MCTKDIYGVQLVTKVTSCYLEHIDFLGLTLNVPNYILSVIRVKFLH